MELGRFTKTPYLVLFIILGAVGVSAAYGLITITLAGNVVVTGDLDVAGNISGPTIDNLQTQIDNVTNALFSCESGGETCTAGIGECQNSGVFVCVSGNAECSASPGTASAELCDGFDNNCDGQTDDTFLNLGAVCSVGIGECESMGTFVCSADEQGTECNVTPGAPSAEICDGLDNNCDGLIDEVSCPNG